jgi:hypothetical protein
MFTCVYLVGYSTTVVGSPHSMHPALPMAHFRAKPRLGKSIHSFGRYGTGVDLKESRDYGAI